MLWAELCSASWQHARRVSWKEFYPDSEKNLNERGTRRAKSKGGRDWNCRLSALSRSRQGILACKWPAAGYEGPDAPFRAFGCFQLQQNQEDVGRGGGDRKQRRLGFQGLTRNTKEH